MHNTEIDKGWVKWMVPIGDISYNYKHHAIDKAKVDIILNEPHFKLKSL